jgi:hypothetical protein
MMWRRSTSELNYHGRPPNIEPLVWQTAVCLCFPSQYENVRLFVDYRELNILGIRQFVNTSRKSVAK